MNQVRFPDLRVGATPTLVLTPTYGAGNLRGDTRTANSATVALVDTDRDTEGGIVAWSSSPYGFQFDATEIGSPHPAIDGIPCYIYDNVGNAYLTEVTGISGSVYTCETLPPSVDTSTLVRWRMPCRPLAQTTLVSPYTSLTLGAAVTAYAGNRAALWKFGFPNGDFLDAVGRFEVLPRITTPGADAVLSDKSPGETHSDLLEVTYSAGVSKGLPVPITAASFFIGTTERTLAGTFASVAGTTGTTAETLPQGLPDLAEFPLVLTDANGVALETYVTADTENPDYTHDLTWSTSLPSWFGPPTLWGLPLTPMLAFGVAVVDGGNVTLAVTRASLVSPGAHLCLVRLTVAGGLHWLSCPFDVTEGVTF